MNRHYLITLLVLLFSAKQALAETVHIPLKIDFPLLHKLVINQLFTDKEQSKEILQDPKGCSKITLSDPKLSESNHHLQINTRIKAHLAIKAAENCVPLLDWNGHAQITTLPIVKKENNRVIYLQVLDSQLFGQDNKLITSGPLWDKAKQHIHPFFDQFQYDLEPSIDELKQFLPLFLAKQPRTQLDKSLNSLHLNSIQVTAKGIKSQLTLDIETIAQSTQHQQVLSPQEKLQWEKKWQSMDALLTKTIKYFASATELKELKLALFDILMDARYQLQNALHEDQTNDPVKHWFIDSWSKLIPIIQQISEENPRLSSVALMSAITANDALQALNKLGPTFGLDISVDGLRRLARLLNNSDIDPLKYDKKLDPQLIQLFQFTIEKTDNPQSRLDFLPISSAQAEDLSPNNWLQTPQNLESYLFKTRKKLLKIADQSLEESSLTIQQQAVFKKLVMATAWQESCWRQYIVQNKKIVPLRSSTGDTGIMQVNEIIWRGFLNKQKLRWDIEYNIQAGSKILLDYMLRYAIKKNEQQQKGGIDNLARSAYSTYNGGPAQVARYRTNNIAHRHKAVDNSFYKKYLSVKQGKELAVAKCLGGKELAQTNSEVKTNRQTKREKSLIQNEAWVNQQPSNYFTIQLGAFSSRQAAKIFINKQNKKGSYAIYKKKAVYVVSYGYYSTHFRASREAKSFKQITPWIRQFKDVKN